MQWCWQMRALVSLADAPQRRQVTSWQRTPFLGVCLTCWGALPGWLCQAGCHSKGFFTNPGLCPRNLDSWHRTVVVVCAGPHCLFTLCPWTLTAPVISISMWWMSMPSPNWPSWRNCVNILRLLHLPVRQLIGAAGYSLLLFQTTSIGQVVPKFHYKSPCQMFYPGDKLNCKIFFASVVLFVLSATPWMVRLHDDP